jgi:MFS family permease
VHAVAVQEVDRPTGAGRPRPARKATVALGVAMTSYAMQQTAVFPALPTIRSDLHTSTAWVAWIFSAYMLTTATSTAIMGRLGDQYGKRRLIMITLGLFVAGSLGAAVAPNIWFLIGARAVQGFGGGVVPLCVSVVRDIFPRERVGTILGALFAMLALGTSLGVLMGGLAVDLGSWRLIFAVAAVPMAISIVLVYRFVPPPQTRKATETDIVGAILLPIGLAAGLLAITEGEGWGWGSGRIVGLGAASIALLAAWSVFELRARAPMVDMRMLAQRTVMLANLASVLLSFSLFAPLVVLPIFLALRRDLPAGTAAHVGYGFSSSATAIGLYFMPGFLAALGAGPLSGLLGRRYGTRVPLAVGMATLGSGCLAMSIWHDRPWQIVAGLVGVGIGQPVAASACATLILGAVCSAETGVAAGVHQVIRTVGAAVATVAGAAILTADHIPGTSIPRLSAFVTILWLCTGSAAVGLLVAALVHRGEGRSDVVVASSAID